MVLQDRAQGLRNKERKTNLNANENQGTMFVRSLRWKTVMRSLRRTAVVSGSDERHVFSTMEGFEVAFLIYFIRFSMMTVKNTKW